jgi:hypothetical protein
MWHAGDPGPPCTATCHDRALIRRPVCPKAFAIARTRSQAEPRPEPSPVDPDRLTPANVCRLCSPPALDQQSSAAARASAPLWPPDPARTDQIRSRIPLHPEPFDLNPTAEIRGYRFSLMFLLKSPSASSKSTRHPSLFKNNSRKAQFLMSRPLTFLKI